MTTGFFNLPARFTQVARLDHIAIAAADLEMLISFHSGLLGLPASPPRMIPEEQVMASFIDLPGSRIELVQPTSETSPVAKFVRERGGGLHHVCFEVTDLDEALSTLKAAGLQLIDEKPRRGTQGSRVAFIHPRSTHRVLIELTERRHAQEIPCVVGEDDQADSSSDVKADA